LRFWKKVCGVKGATPFIFGGRMGQNQEAKMIRKVN